MKTFKTLLLAGAGLLFAGAVNAQVAAPQPALQGPGSITLSNPNGPKNAVTSPNRAGNNDDSYVQQLGTGQYASVIQAGELLSADLIQTSSATNSDAYQEQHNLFGATTQAYIKQESSNSIASQYQNGQSDKAKIVQNSGANSYAYQSQMGNSNTADIEQNGSVNFAQQQQVGASNFARTRQYDNGDWSTIQQVGTSNTALVRQSH